MTQNADPAQDEWRTYDEFAARINTYRKPNVDLAGTTIAITLDDDTRLSLDFRDAQHVAWQASGSLTVASGTVDPCDAVAVRDDVIFVNLPLESIERESVTIVYSTSTHRAIAAHSFIAEEATPEVNTFPTVAMVKFCALRDKRPASVMLTE